MSEAPFSPDYVDKASMGLATSYTATMGNLGKIVGGSGMLKISEKYVSKLGTMYYIVGGSLLFFAFFFVVGLKDVTTTNENEMEESLVLKDGKPIKKTTGEKLREIR
jgi:hypothetical protein